MVANLIRVAIVAESFSIGGIYDTVTFLAICCTHQVIPNDSILFHRHRCCVASLATTEGATTVLAS